MLNNMKSAMRRIKSSSSFCQRNSDGLNMTGTVMCKKVISRMSGDDYVLDSTFDVDKKTVLGPVPKSYKRKISCFKMNYSFTISADTARAIAEKIYPFISAKKNVVIEINPGLGLITEALLEKGVPELILCDNPPDRESLLRVKNEFAKRILHEKRSVPFRGNFHHFIDFYEMLIKWKGLPVKLVGTAPSRCFFRRFLETILLHDMTFCNNAELFFLLEEGIYQCLTNPSIEFSSPSDYAFFSLLMNMTVIAEFPRTHFLPKNRYVDDAYMFLARITRRKWTELVTQDDLRLYFNFMQLIKRRKHGSVIRILESWYPGAGPHLIAEGLSFATQVMELNGKDLYTLFKIFKSLKGFEDLRDVFGSYSRHYVWPFDSGRKPNKEHLTSSSSSSS